MRSIGVMLAAVSLTFLSSEIRASCLQIGGGLSHGSLTETFESPQGTDNQYPETVLEPGDVLDPNFKHANFPPSWGKKSGRIVIGSQNGAAVWRRFDNDSPTGYYFTASILIAVDGLTDGKSITLFVSRPKVGTEGWAAWRLYMAKQQGQLRLAFIVGFNGDTNNPDAAFYVFPVATNQTYDIAITYDTKRRFYSWTVNGQVHAAANMPCDYPLIGVKAIGSSRSSNGRNSEYIVDNVRWYELPE